MTPTLDKTRVDSRLLAALSAVCWSAWLFMCLKYMLVVLFIQEGPNNVDFPKHYMAAEAILEGRDAFLLEHQEGFYYPVFAAWIFSFLGFLPFEKAQTLWNLIHVGFILLTLPIAIRFLRPKAPAPTEAPLRHWAATHWSAIAALGLGLYAPIFLDVRAGNIQPLNLILIIGLCAALARRAEGVAGVLLAMLSLIKILPVFLVPVLWIAGKRRAVAGWAAAMGLYGIALLASGMWRADWRLFTDTLPNVGYIWIGISSSLTVFLGSIFYAPILESKDLFDWTARGVALTVVAGHVAVFALGWPVARRSWRQSVAFASLGIVLISPLIEYAHLTFCIPAWLFLILDYIEQRVGRRYFFAALALWCGVFAGRYWQEVGPAGPVRPLQVSTLCLAALWLLAGGRIIYEARRAETLADDAAQPLR